MSSMPDAPKRTEELTHGREQAPSFDIQKEQQRVPETEQEHQKERESVPKEQEEGFLDETIDSLKSKLKKTKKPVQKQIPQVRDALTLKVEHIMEEGLKDAYLELSPIEKQEFKIKGEETALQIRDLLKGAHVKIKKIFKLLYEWLKLLPGINRFYLEQEAKIKADKIMALKDHYRKE